MTHGRIKNELDLLAQWCFSFCSVYLFTGRVVLSGEVLMTAQGFFQIAIYLIVLLALVKPLGLYMARVYQNESVGLNRYLAGFENLLYLSTIRDAIFGLCT